MAVVWRAELPGPGGKPRSVAVKKMKIGLVGGHDYIAMFMEEARVGAELRHPNIVQVFDLVRDSEGVYCLIMEWVPGIDLRGMLGWRRELGQPMPWDLATYIGIQALLGLTAAHERTSAAGTSARVVHRDISPSNILLADNGAGEAGRLRPGPGAGSGAQPDRAGDHQGQAGLHRARRSPTGAGLAPVGPVRDGLRVVGGAGRPSAVRGAERPGHVPAGPGGEHPAAAQAARRPAQGSGGDCPPGAGAQARAPVRLGAGDVHGAGDGAEEVQGVRRPEGAGRRRWPRPASTGPGRPTRSTATPWSCRSPTSRSSPDVRTDRPSRGPSSGAREVTMSNADIVSMSLVRVASADVEPAPLTAFTSAVRREVCVADVRPVSSEAIRWSVRRPWFWPRSVRAWTTSFLVLFR